MYGNALSVRSRGALVNMRAPKEIVEEIWPSAVARADL